MSNTQYTEALIEKINKNRAHYGFDPISEDRERELIEENACESIGKWWTRSGRTVEEWKASVPIIVGILREEVARSGHIDICDIVDEWEDEHGLTADDLERLDGEIMGWMASARGWRSTGAGSW